MDFIKQSKHKAKQQMLNFTHENSNAFKAMNRIDKFCTNYNIIIANNFDDYCKHEMKAPKRVKKILFLRFANILIAIRCITSAIFPDNKNVTNVMSNLTIY